MAMNIELSELDTKLIVQSLKIWAGDFPKSGCEPSVIWQKELRKLIEKIKIEWQAKQALDTPNKKLKPLGAEMADAFDKILER